MRIVPLLLLGLAACDSTDPDAPTWHRDVAPIVAQHCTGCHVEGGIAPFTLTDYASAHVMATQMVSEIETGRMPPWAAETTDECQPRYDWANDIRLTESEKQTLRDWADAGAPEGDPADAPEFARDDAETVPDPDLELQAEVPWTATGDSDQFRCFVLDPGLTEDTYVTGMQVVAGNPSVVHHALIFLDPNLESEGMAAVGDSYECFGSPGFDDTSLVGAWAPGGVRMTMPPDTATTIPAGSRIVVQVHYHPAGRDDNAPDATTIQLWTTPTAPHWESTLRLIGNFEPGDDIGTLLPGPDDAGGPEFRIPAGMAGHTETMVVDLPSYIPKSRLWAVGTHMHYVGTDMKISIDRRDAPEGEPDSECLIQTPHWDFNWQRGYAYDAPLDEVPFIQRGDRLELRCTYDNSMDNPFVARALEDAGLDAPVDVTLGESTLDEMCLGVFALASERVQ
jgi:hypothetical protein